MKAKWINEQTWVCLNHLSTVRLPANSPACWYAGCRSTRPEKRPEPPVRLVTNIPDAESHKLAIERVHADLAEIKATARPAPPAPPAPPEPSIIVEVREIVKPAPEKKRGGVLVKCGVCETELYRKPSDVAKSKSGVFFCSREHQDQYAAKPITTDTAVTPNAVACAICSTPLKRKPSEISGNKLGVFFCSREHQNQWYAAKS